VALLRPAPVPEGIGRWVRRELAERRSPRRGPLPAHDGSEQRADARGRSEPSTLESIRRPTVGPSAGPPNPFRPFFSVLLERGPRRAPRGGLARPEHGVDHPAVGGELHPFSSGGEVDPLRTVEDLLGAHGPLPGEG